MLLFVRERTHVNLWSWLQAKLDPDIDLVKQSDVTGGPQPARDRPAGRVRHGAVAGRRAGRGVARARLQGAGAARARRVALPHTFSTPGKDDTTVQHDLFAWKVLRPVRPDRSTADGQELTQPGDLSKIVKSHDPGSSVRARASSVTGSRMTVKVPWSPRARGSRLIGVNLGTALQAPRATSTSTRTTSAGRRPAWR